MSQNALFYLNIPARMDEDMQMHVEHDFDKDNSSRNLEMMYEHIKCRLVAKVTVPVGDDHFDLWLDDEGLLVNDPQLNLRATVFAGQDIYGTVLLMRSSGQHIATLTPDDVPVIEEHLKSRMLAMFA